MTVREAYETAIEDLKHAGFDRNEARTCARLLIDDFTKTSHAHLSIPQQLLFEDTFPKPLFDELERVLRGEPLAHVLGKRAFFGLDFLCDKRALIPRPETELLVENATEKLRDCKSPLIADLGTGSGCIAVSLAHELPQCVVYATDLSPDALGLARQNARLHKLENRIEFVEGQSGEWAQPLISEGFARQFSCIVTNPPYISRPDIEELPTQIRDFEPRLALDGGGDGLDCYRQIAAQCPLLLCENGFLLAELGAAQFDDVKTIFECAGWKVEPPILDLANHKRVLSAMLAK